MTAPAEHETGTVAADRVPVRVVDVRSGGTVAYARDEIARARALRDECLAWLPAMVGVLVPVLDRVSRRWLRRSCSPYVAEIEAIADALGFSGVWLLNGCYQWGCTTLARDEGGAPWLARTLDWPFPGLGRHVEIARMRGEAGEFFNVTWPGYVGVLTGMAPGRFAGALNQAPLRRRTRHPWLRVVDIAVNAVQTWWSASEIPPDQLLRVVFEQCRSFEAARRSLETTPIARPAIFTLIGCEPGEWCVIERTERDHATHAAATASNDWLDPVAGWEARVAGGLLMTCSVEEAARNSRDRREALALWPGAIATDRFAWVRPPVLNPLTRMAVETCAAQGVLRVVGLEVPPSGGLPEAVTGVGEVAISG